MVIKLIKSFIYSLNGFRQAYGRDMSFRMEVWAGAFFILFGYLFWPLSGTEIIFLALAFAIILIAELINTAFETVLEKLHPGHHELVGISKDIASAAVLVAVLFAVIVAVVIAAAHLEIIA